jgi:nucleoside-diphosphate-sugar epimerase
VLVTGARGFVGRHTLDPLIAKGFEVHAVRSASGAHGVDDQGAPGSAHVTWHTVDLLDAEAGRRLIEGVRPDRLLHLAWTVEHGRFWADPRNRDWLAASVALIQHFGARGGRHVVVAGTCAEYDWTDLGDDRCVEGRTAVMPRTPYGVAKQELHDALLTSDELRDARVAWGRLFLLYGPGEHPDRLVPSVARALLEGKPARTASGRHVRDFLDVRDAAAAFVALLDSDVRGAVNVASGRGTTIAEVVGCLAELTGRGDLVTPGALPDRENDPPVLVADVRRLSEEVKYRPTRLLRDGLSDAVEWWRQRMSDVA